MMSLCHRRALFTISGVPAHESVSSSALASSGVMAVSCVHFALTFRQPRPCFYTKL